MCLSLFSLRAPVPGQLVLQVRPPSHMADPWTVGLQRVEDSGTQAATGEAFDSSQEPGPLFPAKQAPMRVVLQQEGVRATAFMRVSVDEGTSEVLELPWTRNCPAFGHKKPHLLQARLQH